MRRLITLHGTVRKPRDEECWRAASFLFIQFQTTYSLGNGAAQFRVGLPTAV